MARRSPKLADQRPPAPDDLNDLEAAPYNPRKIDPKAAAGLSASLREFGDLSGLVYNEQTGHLIAGHQRREALLKMGPNKIEWAPEPHETDLGPERSGILRLSNGAEFSVRGVRWTAAKERAANIAANSPSIAGEFTDDLDELLDQVKLDFPDLYEELRFDDIRIEPKSEEAEGNTDPDTVPDLPENPVPETGFVRMLGSHILVCGDSRYLDTIGERFRPVKLVVTSPPYNCDVPYASHKDKTSIDDYLGVMRAVIESIVPLLVDGCFVAWNIGTTPGTRPWAHANLLHEAGLQYVREIVWRKPGVHLPIWNSTTTNPKARKYQPNYNHEMIYLFSKGDPVFGEPCTPDDKYSNDVWDVTAVMSTIELKRDLPDRIGRRTRKGNGKVNPRYPGGGAGTAGVHPACFPVAIPAGPIKHLTAKGERVLDPFGGAGTTMIACEQLGREAVLVEMDPRYCDLIVERWQNFTGKKAERLVGGA